MTLTLVIVSPVAQAGLAQVRVEDDRQARTLLTRLREAGCRYQVLEVEADPAYADGPWSDLATDQA